MECHANSHFIHYWMGSTLHLMMDRMLGGTISHERYIYVTLLFFKVMNLKFD